MTVSGWHAGEDSLCRVCGSAESTTVFDQAKDYITDELFMVRFCTRCGVGFTHPLPASMSRFYPSYYRQYSRFPQAMLRLLYGWRARSWIQPLSASGRALEIGCGNGWMLRELRRRGWSVVGNERTVQSALFASTVNGLPVFVGQLEALKPLPQFELIILFQVLEHLTDPLRTLRQCASLLKEGGILVVSVPNMKSWQAKWTGQSWFHLDVPRHLFHFSPSSLSHTLELAGFDVVAVRFASLVHDPYGWVQSLLNQLGFPHNLLTKVLMGMNRRAVLSPAGLVMVFAAALLVVPGLLMAMTSWGVGAGAFIEVVAAKPNRDEACRGGTG